MSDYSSYNTYESEEEESSGWLLTSENSIDDDLSDELTLLNGDEDCDKDTSSFEALIQLSIRLKKEYNLREAAVQLERCDKIWDTIQIVKKMQLNCENETPLTGHEGDDDDDEDDEDDEDDDDNEDGNDEKSCDQSSNSGLPEVLNSSVPYIKYQPVQGNGNTALPNFYLSVKSQKTLFHCVACGKQFSEKRSLRNHSMRDHGIVVPKLARKARQSTETKIASQDVNDNKIINNSGKDRESTKSRLSNTSNTSTEQKSNRKRDRDKNTVKLEPKKEPEEYLESLLLDFRVKHFTCRICGYNYRYNRGVIKHMMNAHNMTLAEAGTLYDSEKSIAPVELPHKENPPATKARDSKKVKNVNEENCVDSVSLSSGQTKMVSRWYNYVYTCKSCGYKTSSKQCLRSHLFKSHKKIINHDLPRKRKPDEVIADYGNYTSTLLKIVPFTVPTKVISNEIQKKVIEPLNEEKKPTRRYRRNDKNYRATSRVVTTTNDKKPRKTRSGREIIDNSNNPDRPQRACAKNTTYTDCTKEEEEVLRNEILGTNSAVTQDSNKPSTGQTSRCFLCKRSPTDMEKHLQDYHKIKCLEKILPLTEEPVDNVKNDESVVSNETHENFDDKKTKEEEQKIDITEKTKSRRNKQKYKTKRMEMKNEYIRVLYNTMYRSILRKKLYQCTICSYKFPNFSHILRHLDNNTKKGVICHHLPPIPKSINYRNPLTISSSSSSSLSSLRSESRSNTSEDNIVEIKKSKKRELNTTDERNDERNKKRKIHEPKAIGNIVSDLKSNEPDPLLIVSEGNCPFNDTDKSDNPRDTRDSSDRDSGIGISITIKKRNNSYEVVEKDSGDDEKFKDNVKTKNINNTISSSSESSSFNHTPVIFFNDNQEARRREIMSSLNCSVEGNTVTKTIVTVNDDKILSKKNTVKLDSCLGNDEEAILRLRENEEYLEDKTISTFSGNVPSLKIMCKSVLRASDELTRLCDTITHQCPICHRFYSTEREVTVHMIEHKVINGL